MGTSVSNSGLPGSRNFDPDLEQHDVVADVQATPTSGRVLLFDGFTITAADTPENQNYFLKTQRKKKAWLSDHSRCQFDLDGDWIVGCPCTWPPRRKTKWRNGVAVEDA